METFRFKKLEIKKERSWIRRLITSPLFYSTFLYCIACVLIAYAIFYFGQEGNATVFWNDTAAEYVFIGFGFGVFLSTSPCARGRCR
ncbi:MAG: hypothetical protein MI866_07295 [Bacteroidales bacterium]|nr:hypothetical protein [Bacteroidales bacterium]